MKYLVLVLALIISFTTFAGEQEDKKTIQQMLMMAIPGIEVSSIEATPVAGLYEVVISGDIVYMTADGRYLFLGASLIDIVTRSNLTEEKKLALQSEQAQAVLQLLANYPEEKMVVYPAKGEQKHVITMFTDLNCPYCRKFHNNELETLNNNGVSVRYLFFPIIGADSRSKTINVWCSKDRLQAVTDAKNGKKIPEAPKGCQHPIDEHEKFAREIGVQGTPFIIVENQIVPGYRPAQDIIDMLNK